MSALRIFSLLHGQQFDLYAELEDATADAKARILHAPADSAVPGGNHRSGPPGYLVEVLRAHSLQSYGWARTQDGARALARALLAELRPRTAGAAS